MKTPIKNGSGQARELERGLRESAAKLNRIANDLFKITLKNWSTDVPEASKLVERMHEESDRLLGYAEEMKIGRMKRETEQRK